MPGFLDVPAKVDFTAQERDTLAWWNREGVVETYLRRNDASERRYSFFDGPITANNPMGVHHAWGRTYKDLFQRYHAMLGERQRFQNGFDCQGLWVEVEVEKELGLKSKRDIESFGVAEFVERCKGRVLTYADRITRQSIRLGYWMDWDDSYLTMSDENNYTIWHFLKTCHERGWIYKGHDVMPWCPRCGTGLSEHEIVTEGYQERTHLSVYARFPLLDEADADLLIWTTTPWTLPANVAAAVHPELTYLRVEQGGRAVYVAKEAAKTAIRGDHVVTAEVSGAELVGRPYRGPYDELPAADGIAHRVIAWDEVDAAEGTGVVHIAPGCGKEDFALSKANDLAVVAPIDEFGIYGAGFGPLSGAYVHEVATPIVQDLEGKGLLYRAERYTHRYPVCWRCGTDLVFRLVDEWFIAMDELRGPMMAATREVEWIPAFGKERELDWLAHMDDWMISKKRYWGLALPIYECGGCGGFEVIGSETELRERAIAGWEEFAGHTPHRPWIDAVKIACKGCGEAVGRVTDVGNPWLDAGIIPFSTLGYRHDRAAWEEWFPADMISESFPGQFRNWFYSLIAQSAALEGRAPFKTVFAYALMRDEKGAEMHKSKGNAIWFDDAAEQYGVDVMRWLFATVNPTANVNFGPNVCDEVRRRFIIPLWNSYSFFATYARLDGFDPHDAASAVPLAERSLLDRWIVSRLNQVVARVRDRLDAYDPDAAAKAIEGFVVEELSNWYIRRNRRRFWRSEGDRDKAAAYRTLHECLVTLSRLLAPFVPFLAETMHQNLVRAVDPDAPVSVHLTDYPTADPARIDAALTRDMAAVLEVVGAGRSARSESGVKVRQPLPAILVYARDPATMEAVLRLKEQVLDELNVKEVRPLADLGGVVAYDIRPNLSLLGPKYGKRLGRIRQALAKAEPAAVASSVGAGVALRLKLDDDSEVALEPTEVLVDLKRRAGYAAAQGASVTVVLDTSLTPALIQEGLARDFVRGVQDARKSAGYRIEDTIAVSYEADPEVVAAIGANESTVRAETLAVRLERLETAGFSDAVEPEAVAGPGGETGADGRYRDQITVGQHQVRIALQRSSGT
ncbi:MAG: Isoleucyl-tRNA synthetase [uncultured Thermomicrobiales bacterium]|uniref:Isoleucine--tRNA ligase n=1 Tax=uncultured Thermomicrobiales bacterium TaxID=1645740 RepID=A0A6J4VAH5_9BACT|nr:MAG: Isoleucyl-tRNA synthetase [uncultured Thermomicrobiales bacterium]